MPVLGSFISFRFRLSDASVRDGEPMAIASAARQGLPAGPAPGLCAQPGNLLHVMDVFRCGRIGGGAQARIPAIYIGPVLVFTVRLPLIAASSRWRKARLTSIADFLGARYGKNSAVASDRRVDLADRSRALHRPAAEGVSSSVSHGGHYPGMPLGFDPIRQSTSRCS